ncbi:hypothetical protein EIP86_006488 [Pleurotus ostreatoroseus]|nr:hypothetical protein EIP86_006488 [Pleurotus ostreatoroseus]
MARGSIKERMEELQAENKSVPEILWAHEIASGLKYLHDEGIVHGDLRGANVLVDHDNHVYIADFGLSFLPDMSRSSGGDTTYHRGASDVYSFGCVCFEICNGAPPYAHLRDHQVITVVITGDATLEWPVIAVGNPAKEELRSIAARCQRFKPSVRPDISIVDSELSALLDEQGVAS